MRPDKERGIRDDYFAIIKYTHDLEDQVKCYKKYFMEMSK